MSRWLMGILLILGGLLVACQGAAPPPQTAEPAAPAPFMGSCKEVTGPLQLAMWYEEVVPEVLEDFEALYGVEIDYDTYSSNEQLLAMLEAGETQYDLVFPSDYAVQILIEQGVAQKLNKDNIPNRLKLTTVLAYYFDPPNDYSMPFQWGTTGIAYNSRVFESPPDSWTFLFDPSQLERHQGKITMLDEERETIGAALLYLGYDVNDTNPEHLAAAATLLLTQQPYLAGYDSEGYATALASEEILLAHAWSGQAATAARENDAIRYVVPTEGAVIWMDNMVIPQGSAHKCTVELLMNYLIEPSVSAQISSHTLYQSPVPSAEPLYSAEAKEILARGFAISGETINRLQWIEYRGDPQTYTRVWEQLREP